MKYNKHLTWLATLSVVTLSIFMSCSEDYFDTDIGGRIDPSEHYNSFEDAIFSYYGCFAYLQDIADKMIIVDGLRSDQMDVTPFADRDMVEINRHEITSSNAYVDPSSFYKMIVNINEVLPNLPQIVEKDRDFNEVMLETYTGDLISLRAWAYLNLAKLNGEVGLVPEDVSSIDPSVPPTYLNKVQIIDKLIAELLPYYDPEDLLRFRVDHYVLLGELYLEKNDYANAAKYLKYACDGDAVARGYYMVNSDNEQEAWLTLFFNSSERSSVITAVNYDLENDQKNMLEEWMNYRYMVKPSIPLMAAYDKQVQVNGNAGDIYRGLGRSYDTTSMGEPYIQKYSIHTGIPFGSDIILYRAADVHLMLAEALNRLGQTDNALTLLNSGFKSSSNRPAEYSRWRKNEGVRGRVYLEELTVPAGVNAVEYVEDLILEERAMELSFEGKRWFDLVRVAKRRGDPAYLANKVAAKFEDKETADYVRAKLMDESSWYIPISKVN